MVILSGVGVGPGVGGACCNDHDEQAFVRGGSCVLVGVDVPEPIRYNRAFCDNIIVGNNVRVLDFAPFLLNFHKMVLRPSDCIVHDTSCLYCSWWPRDWQDFGSSSAT